MRCPWCGQLEDRVIDSRPADGGEAIRRRRECRSCGRRYTTFERVEAPALLVVKRDGTREPWDRAKLLAGVQKALANRPVGEDRVQALVGRVESRLRRRGPEVTSQQVGVEVLQGLQKLDQIGYLRFASVYKDFQEVGDFERELGLLLQKKEPAKRRAR
ncbi:MAG TPA: transcriptional regulator NrdR [Actinomycetota bacterium]